MKSVVIATLFASVMSFANPGATGTPAAGTPAAGTGTPAAAAAPADHGKMGHGAKAKAGATQPECKEKNADGSCKTEAKK